MVVFAKKKIVPADKGSKKKPVVTQAPASKKKGMVKGAKKKGA